MAQKLGNYVQQPTKERGKPSTIAQVRRKFWSNDLRKRRKQSSTAHCNGKCGLMTKEKRRRRKFHATQGQGEWITWTHTKYLRQKVCRQDPLLRFGRMTSKEFGTVILKNKGDMLGQGPLPRMANYIEKTMYSDFLQRLNFVARYISPPSFPRGRSGFHSSLTQL